MEIDNLLKRLEKKMADWQAKLEKAESELQDIAEKRLALEAARDKHVLAARAEGDPAARLALDEAREALRALSDEELELTVLAGQIKEKMAGLQGQTDEAVRKKALIQLDAQSQRRSKLAEAIETKTDELAELLREYRDLGFDMYSDAKALGCGHAAFYGHRAAASFLHYRLGQVLPHDFSASLGKRVDSLAKVDAEAVAAVLRGHGLSLKRRQPATQESEKVEVTL